MLWTLFIALLLGWLICVIILPAVGLAIHLLLLAAVVVLFSKILEGRRK